MRYWYHSESDSALEDANPSNETETLCVELSKEEYDTFKLGEKKKTMSVGELTTRYDALEKEARATSLTIGQHEQRVDHALEMLKEALPGQDVSDPRAIPFEALIKGVQEQIDALTEEIDHECTVLEQRVKDANAELHRLVEKKG